MALAPLVLVFVGAQLLLRGDLVPSTHARTFGITRGNVESASLEIQSGEIDVFLRALPSSLQERLIAGQYATQSRPRLEVDGTMATLALLRGDTPWFTFADWELGISQNMPWQVIIGSTLGQIDADLSEIIIDSAHLSAGFGDVRVVLPSECLGEGITISAQFGTIHISHTNKIPVHIRLNTGRFSRVYADPAHYQRTDSGDYQTLNVATDSPPLLVHVHNTFGDIYLA